MDVDGKVTLVILMSKEGQLGMARPRCSVRIVDIAQSKRLSMNNQRAKRASSPVKRTKYIACRSTRLIAFDIHLQEGGGTA